MRDRSSVGDGAMSAKRIEALREMVEKDPKDALARHMLAEELFRAGDYQDTVSELEVYVKLQKDEGAAYRTLGDALVKLGKKKDARWAFRHGAEAAPGPPPLQLPPELGRGLRELLGGS